MGRASYQPSHDNFRIGQKPCGRVGRIEASLIVLGAHRAMVKPYARAIGIAYPDCQRVTEILAVPNRKLFNYRDGQGNLRRGELK